MKAYTGDKIRNVAIVGHGGAGTTSVTEALLYRAGAIDRMCKVEDGATTTDYEPEEIKRGVSVNATLAQCHRWRTGRYRAVLEAGGRSRSAPHSAGEQDGPRKRGLRQHPGKPAS